MTVSSAVKRVAIVGGGTAGWIAAAEMACLLPNIYREIVLVESPDIGSIGVGEATIPPFVSFLRALGVNEVDFIRETQATFKLGIQFKDWLTLGHDYFHPFGGVGPKIQEMEFAKAWFAARSHELADDFQDYSSAVEMCRQSRFYLPFKMGKNSPVASANYALHLDAVLAANYLRRFATDRGVRRIVANVSDVELGPDGVINKLVLDRQESLAADFFIDCTGFKSLLIGKALNVAYEDWSDFLPCNRAVVIQTENQGELVPYTVSQARGAGWSWHIPLQHRTGNGYVYCSDYISDDEAAHDLLASLSGRPLMEPRLIPFRTGKRKQIWYRNCLALGLASGFLEPLESTAIHLINRCIQLFLDMRPDQGYDSHKQERYNASINEDYCEIRDFLILHYCTSKRSDSAFWCDRRELALPWSLKDQLDMLQRESDIHFRSGALFSKNSWWAVYFGMAGESQFQPISQNVYEISEALSQYRKDMRHEVDSLPTHKQFIEQYCAAKTTV